MIELSNIEIDAVSGGVTFGALITIGNALVEFGTGFWDGVLAATQ